MRKWLTGVAIAAVALIGTVWAFVHQIPPSGISVGTPLPPGKVRPQLAIGSDSAEMLAPDGSFSLALKNDGSLWGWGNNMVGELGNGTSNNESLPTLIGTDRDWREIAAAHFTSFALKQNGTLWEWGQARLGVIHGGIHLVPTQINPGTNWCAVSAGGDMALALKTDGTLWQREVDAEGRSPDLFQEMPERKQKEIQRHS
jgi:alpha-tubulin suppressor-like RCC1 family protein